MLGTSVPRGSHDKIIDVSKKINLLIDKDSMHYVQQKTQNLGCKINYFTEKNKKM